jgi:hypothetical protein
MKKIKGITENDRRKIKKMNKRESEKKNREKEGGE